MDSCIDVTFEIFSQNDNCSPESAESPTDEEGENTNGGEGETSLPTWPIERIIDIVGRLRHEDDIGAAFDFMTRHHYSLEM
jgi:hypothetical protein